jgi:uncharacterized protein (TIGR00369 family)
MSTERPMVIDQDELRRIVETPPLHAWLGLRLTEARAGEVVIELPYRPELLATPEPENGYVHGGILATLLDLAGDFALATLVGRGIPTIDLRVDYLRPALPGRTLVATGTVVRSGRRLGVADARVRDAEDGRELAVARGAWATG